jgi:hypothetical protein
MLGGNGAAASNSFVKAPWALFTVVVGLSVKTSGTASDHMLSLGKSSGTSSKRESSQHELFWVVTKITQSLFEGARQYGA